MLKKNVLIIMAIFFTMAWHGWMEKAIVITQMTVDAALV